MNVVVSELLSSIELNDGDAIVLTEPDPVLVTIQQLGSPVGGVASQVNKLTILTPYLALGGLIVAVSTVYVIKRRKA